MIPEKNLSRLVEAYHLYREHAPVEPWDLVLVGSGPQEISLRRQVDRSAIKGVWFAGLRQMDELPLYYARAKCLVLPSISEPWGLVVNEAMASGLPVLVSNRCGCAADLVRHGCNGFIFDPLNVRTLANLFRVVSSGSTNLEELGTKSREIVENYSTPLFAERASNHFAALYKRKRPNWQRREDIVTVLNDLQPLSCIVQGSRRDDQQHR